MGKFNPNNNNQIYQEVTGALAGSVFSAPAFADKRIYYGAVGDAIKAFSFNASGLLNPTPASATSTNFEYPGATPSISGSSTKQLDFVGNGEHLAGGAARLQCEQPGRGVI